VNQDHERIEELLAGYVLLSLSGEDAIEADLLISEHVPSCPMCRDTMAGFQTLAGDLALAPEPSRPPELLLQRIRHSITEAPVRRRRSASFVAVAAGVAALVALSGLSLSLGNRASKAEQIRGQLLDVLGTLQQPGVNHVSLEPQGQTTQALLAVSGPGLEHMYIVGRDVPYPAAGRAYQLWLGSNGTFTRVGTEFVPEEGLVCLSLTFNPAPFDEILITEESVGSLPPAPSQDSLVWHASLSTAG
jgi:hypothetical protein